LFGDSLEARQPFLEFAAYHFVLIEKQTAHEPGHECACAPHGLGDYGIFSFLLQGKLNDTMAGKGFDEIEGQGDF
jgi:hypothetical protein